MTTAVALRHLVKRFNTTVAVADMSAEIQRGEFVALLGPSGCGKTTTLRMIAGFIEPDGGTIEVNGRVLSSAGSVVRPEDRGMAMVFQSYALWPHMTVYENVAYGVKLKRTFRGDIRRRVMSMLDTVKMADFAGRYPGELSGGQQQRVALARALAVEPALLLMDEPLSNLDAHLREEMRIEIRRLHDEIGVTTVYVTHDLVEAMVVSDRIIVMRSGLVEQVGSPEEIYANPRSRFVAGFIGKTNFLRARVEERDARKSMLIGTFRVWPAEGALGRWQPGDDVVIALRAHDLLMARQPDHEVSVTSGQVKQHIFLGDLREYVVQVDALETSLRIVTRADERYQTGEQVFVEVPSSKCLVVAE